MHPPKLVRGMTSLFMIKFEDFDSISLWRNFSPDKSSEEKVEEYSRCDISQMKPIICVLVTQRRNRKRRMQKDEPLPRVRIIKVKIAVKRSKKANIAPNSPKDVPPQKVRCPITLKDSCLRDREKFCLLQHTKFEDRPR